jgi:glycosyltransferase involved in cell wall biosynthesis
MKLSIILCCYNSATRIEPTLSALSSQQTEYPWEIILVDNNSSDNTSEMARKTWNTYSNSIPFFIVEEKTPGLSAARKKGIVEAKGELILFCDDDNHLSPDYIQQAVQIMAKDTMIGALCGFNDALIEGHLPDRIKQHLTSYACGHEGMESCYLEDRIVPWGAGLVLRAEFLKRLYHLNFESLLSDRTGKELSSGGDTEICYLLRLCGYRWKYDNRLYLKHAIPSNRLNIEYLKRLYSGFGHANVIIDWYYKRGEINTLKHEVNWWKAYLMQRWYFIKNPIKKSDKNADLSNAYREGYLEKLIEERKRFRSKQITIRKIIAQLTNVH